MNKNLLFFMLILAPIAISSKFYIGPGAQWVTGSLSSILFVMFWCLFLRLLLKRHKDLTLTGGVFVFACVREILQLWHPSVLQAARETLLGQTLLGTTFSWNAFPYYFVGAWIAQQVVKKFSSQSALPS